MNILVINNEREKEDYGWLPDLKKNVLEVVDADFIVKHFTEASAALVNEYQVDYVILTGRLSPWDMDELALFQGEYDLIKNCQVPLLGICAGLQLMGMAYGAKMDYICSKEKEKVNENGFFNVKILKEDKIFTGITSPMIVYEHHYCELKEIPEGFIHLASSETTLIQCIKHKSRNVYGVQFHPEKFDEEHLDGKNFLHNFFSLK